MRGLGNKLQGTCPREQLPLFVLNVHTRKSLLTLPPVGQFCGLKMLLPCFLFWAGSLCYPEKQLSFILPPSPRKIYPYPEWLVKFFFPHLSRMNDSIFFFSLQFRNVAQFISPLFKGAMYFNLIFHFILSIIIHNIDSI